MDRTVIGGRVSWVKSIEDCVRRKVLPSSRRGANTQWTFSEGGRILGGLLVKGERVRGGGGRAEGGGRRVLVWMYIGGCENAHLLDINVVQIL